MLARPPLALFMAAMAHCAGEPAPAPAPARPLPAAPSPVAQASLEAIGPAHCTHPQATNDEQRALAAWLARNPVDTNFVCPSLWRIVQREQWWVPISELIGLVTDDVAPGPTRRVNLGERVVYWGIDPASGDALTLSLGRIDAVALDAAQATFATKDHKWDPDFEEAQQRLGGPWRGLGFEPRSGAPARALRQWLTELPAGRLESFPIGWQATMDDDDLPTLPRLIHLAGPTNSTLCIQSTAASDCWSTAPLEIDRTEILDDSDAIEVTARAGAVRVAWQLDITAGTWSSSTKSRAGKARRFERTTALPRYPDALASGWVKSLADDWIVAGAHEYDSQGLVPTTLWTARRYPQGWRIGAVDGDLVLARIEWNDPENFGLILGYEPGHSGDGLTYAARRFTTFTTEGDWFAPAGHLPLPILGMAALRDEGGWEYAYNLRAREPRCIDITLDHSTGWQVEGNKRRNFTLELPMSNLSDVWSIGPEGLRRGC